MLYRTGEIKLTEKHLKLSVDICSNRFISRYEIFKFYVNLKMKDNAIQVAKDIHQLDQLVISSHTVAIKKEIEEYMEKHNISQ